jgi:hypothetical protein
MEPEGSIPHSQVPATCLYQDIILKRLEENEERKND